MSFWTKASSAEITIVMAAMTHDGLRLASGMEKPSQNTG